MKRFSLHALLSLFLALSFTACDSAEEDGGSVIGDADVTIRGDLEGSLSGSAVFGTDPDDPNDNFGIAIFEGELATTPTGEFIVMSYDGGRPGEGTYQISSTSTESIFFGVYTTDASNPTGGSIVSATSGTLMITSSSSDRVAGSFTFTGPVFSGTGTQGTATVEGTFDAELVEESDFPTTP